MIILYQFNCQKLIDQIFSCYTDQYSDYSTQSRYSIQSCTEFPIKDAKLLTYIKSIYLLFYLPYHYGEDQEYFSILRNGRLLWGTLY